MSMNYRRMLFGAAGLLAACAVFAAYTVPCFAEEAEEEEEEEQEIATYQSGDFTYSRLSNTADDTLKAACIEAYTGSEKDLVIPSELDGLQVVMLGNTAFADADFLETVTIPKTVSGFGTYTFADCNSLKSFEVETGSENYITKDGVLYTADSMMLVHWPAASCPAEPEIPEGLTSIGNVAFSGCNELTTLKMPDSVEHIGVSCFSDCEKLTNVTLSTALTSIESFAFNNCSALKSIVIPEGVTEIGDAAFAATGLESVEIPLSVTTIGQQAFAATPMTEVTIPPTVSEIGYDAFGWRLTPEGQLYMDEEFTIHGRAGTAASEYATDVYAENDFKFVNDYDETHPVEAEETETEAPAETTAPAETDDAPAEEKTNKGLIAGGIGACGLAAAVIAGCVVSKKKKQKDQSEEEESDE